MFPTAVSEVMTLTLTIIILLCSGSVYTDQLSPPQNLRIKSENLGLVLAWDPPQNTSGKSIRYTAEHKSWHSFTAACVNVSSQSCDFTSDVTPFVTYTLRVRAELNEENSVWTEIECEPLEQISVIGAPGVRLQSRRGKMEVDITEPVLRKSRLKEVYSKLLYRIRYWPEGNVEKKELNEGEQSRVMLMNLLPTRRYCVEVDIVLDSVTSLPSNVTCEMNTASDDVESWQIAVVLVVSFLVTLGSVLLIFSAVWYGYRGIQFLSPRAKLPEHIKQYLVERPSSSVMQAMQNSAQPEELYHEFCIITVSEAPPDSKQIWTRDRIHCGDSLQDERPAAEAVKELLLQ